MTVAATTDDLRRLGWARTYPGHWLSPNGLRIVPEAAALREVTAALYPEKP